MCVCVWGGSYYDSVCVCVCVCVCVYFYFKQKIYKITQCILCDNTAHFYEIRPSQDFYIA